MKESFHQTKESTLSTSPILEQKGNNLDTTGINNFMDKFYPDFNNVCFLVERLNVNNLNRDEEKGIINELIKSAEETVVNSNNFLNFKRENLKKDSSPLDLFIINEIHTLKNDVGGINRFSELLIEEGIEREDFEDYLGVITMAIEKSKKLLNHLRDTNINGYEVNKLEVSLNQFINEAIGVLKTTAKDKNINIKNDIKENILVNTDPEIVESALLNLIFNAIKFTKENGNIVVSVDKDNEFIYIHIKDDGVGVSEERQKNFFNELGVTTNGTNDEVGTGVGLYASSNMLEKIRGEISVYSEGEGKGSTFTIKLPL